MEKGFVEVTIIKNLGTHKKGSKVVMHESTAKGCMTNGYVTFGEAEEKTVEDKPKAARRKKTK